MLLLTSGSRGDVEPFVALGRALAERGADVRLCTHARFRSFAEGYGLRFAPLADDLLELADTQAPGEGNPLALVGRARRILREVARDAWTAAVDPERGFGPGGPGLVVHHPKGMVGGGIAEALGAASALAVPVPMLTPTRAFGNPAFVARDLGALLNRFSYALNRGILAPYRGVINDWRRERDLPSLPLLPRIDRLGTNDPLLLYPVSPALVPRPDDWPARARLTGYWFLDDADAQLDPALDAFLDAGPPPVSVGFGSMNAGDAAERARMVVAAAQRSGVRVVLARGWGGLADPSDTRGAEVFAIDGAPYRLLFPRVAAVVHHGGAGTTAQGLRAGKPTQVVPFIGDQRFWGARIAAAGAGPAPIPQKELTADALAAAFTRLTGDAEMRRRAEAIGRRIRAEDGLGRALELLADRLGA